MEHSRSVQSVERKNCHVCSCKSVCRSSLEPAISLRESVQYVRARPFGVSASYMRVFVYSLMQYYTEEYKHRSVWISYATIVFLVG